jgi:8-oxo-dGTP diphosphatase
MEPVNRGAINVVAGLIFRDARLLVCQRHHTGSFPLKWEFPGGKVEENESDLDALCRELKEELAIDAIDARVAWRHEHSYPDGPSVTLRFYNVHAFNGELTNLVFEQISWVKLSELKDFDFLEGDQPLVDQLASMQASELLTR